jgi:hypothetical protein
LATITVTNLDNSGAGSLRAAIGSASAGDTIDFDPGLTGGTLVLTSGELDVNKNLTIDGDIDGNGTPDITISGNNASRVFAVNSGADAALDGLVIAGGFNNAHGGGIYVGLATLTLSNSTVSGNYATLSGGGIYTQFDSSLTVIDSTLSGNTAINGGAIYSQDGTLALVNTTLSDNTAVVSGGAIGTHSGSLTAINTTVSGNLAGSPTSSSYGGGIQGIATAVSLINSTVTGNLSSGNLGSIAGGLYINRGSLTLSNSIVAGNSAGSGNDVIANGGATFTEANDIFGSALSVPDPPVNGVNGTIIIDGSNATELGNVFAQVGPDPNTGVLSGVLGHNGGSVETVALKLGSIAIDAGSNAALPADTYDVNNNGNTTEPLPVDARGSDRVSGTSVDIGAFEYQPTPTDLVVTTLDDELYNGGSVSTETNDGNGLSLPEAIGLANAAGGSHTITFDPSLAAGTLTLTNGELVITSDITIDGDIDGNSTPDITIDGSGISRVFNIGGGVSGATLDGLIIEHGTGGTGGGVYIAAGDTVTLRDTDVRDNFSFGTGGRGGGIYAGANSSLTLFNSTVSQNQIYGHGGGIGVGAHGAVALVDSIVSDNNAFSRNSEDGFGGGIYLNDYASLAMTNSTLSGNAALYGGGIYGFAGNTITLSDSTITGNNAHEGGGVFSWGFDGATTTVDNSIIAGNAAATSPDLRNNYNSTIVFEGGNILGSAPGLGLGVTLSGQGNYTQIDGTNAAALGTVFAQVGHDPNTGVLSGVPGNNGGPVQTVALNPTGIAIDTGSLASLPADTFDLNNNGSIIDQLPVDARGFDRVSGTSVDIGAFEQQAAQSFVVTTLHDELDSTNPSATLADMGGANDLSLREALFLASEDPTVADTITFDPSLAGGTIHLTLGQLETTSDVTVDGDIDVNGTPDITVDAGGNSQVLLVSGGTATVNGLILERGYSAGGGGGVYVANGANLNLADSAIYDSSAVVGGGLTVGIGSKVTLTGTTVAGNYAADFGGGIVSGGTLTLYDSTISGNGAGAGVAGGLDVASGTAVLTNTTVSGNYSEFGSGGGIYNSSSLTLTNSTLSGNYAAVSGGGIYNNTGDSLTLSNSIVAGNADSTNTDDVAGAGATTYSNGNIVGGTFSVDGTQVQTGVTLNSVFASVTHNSYTHVLSGSLRNNGGLVDTIALKANASNPAIDSGNPNALNEATAGIDLNGNGNQTDTITTDARGLARVVNFSGGGANPDLGAFEQQIGQSFVVTTLNDELDSTKPNATITDMGGPGDLSLREALFLANEDPTTADTITFDPSLANGTIDLTLGELEIKGSLTIDGGNDAITIDAQQNSAVLDVTGGTSTLNALTLTGGFAGHGGGVTVGAYSSASLTISNSTITDNQAAYGGGIAVGYAGKVQLTNSTVSGNGAYYVGGGILNSGTLTLTNSTVVGNTAAYIGGGIASRGDLTVINSTLANNQIAANPSSPVGTYDPTFGAGAGLYNGGDAALLNTTISGNSGAYAGGGIYNSEDLTLTNVTIANNSAVSGGGLYNAQCGCGTVGVYDTTITGNDASLVGGGIANANGSVTLTNSIVAGNGAGYQGPDLIAGGGATTTYAGVNLFSQAGVGRAGVDITQTDISQIFSGTLANNGGMVQTVAINPAGSARDTGVTADLPLDTFDLNNNSNTTEPLPVDARGDPRVSGPSVDIGAYEQQPVPTPTNIVVTTLSDETYDGGDIDEETADGNGLSLREAIGLANAAGGSHSITFDQSLAGGTLTLTNGELNIESDITVDGDVLGNDGVANGSGKDDITVDGHGGSIVFYMGGGTSVLNGLTITGGSDLAGGGVYVEGGAVVTVANSTLSGNTAGIYGGAVWNNDSTVTLINTTLSNNTAPYGGAVATRGGSFTAINTTLSGNGATGTGYGGGIWGSSGTVALIDSTVSGNNVPGSGGGVMMAGGTLTLTNSIVAGNAGASGNDIAGSNGPAVILDGGNILGSSPAGAGSVDTTNGDATQIDGASAAALATVFATVGNDPNTGVLSGLLADNGGPVDTIAINPTGIANNGGVAADLPADTTDINHNGNTAELLPVDARGQPRVTGTSVDIGAFEQNAPTIATATAVMVTNRAYDGTYEFYDIGKNTVQLTGLLGAIASPWQVADVGLFAGNTDPEMLMRNVSTGAFEVYDIANNLIANPVSMGQVGLEWQILGFGDFTGHVGETDMLMRNTTTNALELFDINNNAFTGFAAMGSIGPEWQAAGFGDFSGNANETDMLMRNTSTGAFELYDIANNQFTGFHAMGQVGLEWQTLGFGDFSGNANETDMLMRNSSTGALELYDISHNTYTGFVSAGNIGLEWQVAGFADFSGNANETDMLMRNTATGAFEIFDFSHNAITSAAPMGQVGPEWQTADTASIPAANSPAGALLAQALSSFGATPSGSATQSGLGGAGTPSTTDTLFTGQGSHS